jgi:hypothetical protein
MCSNIGKSGDYIWVHPKATKAERSASSKTNIRLYHPSSKLDSIHRKQKGRTYASTQTFSFFTKQ